MNTKRLIGIMAEQRTSQRKLAALMGVSKNTINAKLNGKGSFDTDEATMICNILGITDNNIKADIFLTQSSQK